MTRYYSNGKLLLTGEYLVLESANALALPTQLGQHLNVEHHNNKTIHWTSIDADGTIWFSKEFDIGALNSIRPFKSMGIEEKLIYLLKQAKTLNPKFLDGMVGAKVESRLTFPRHWGLGSSSTLINNIAQWAEVDPYILGAKTFGGSGYDIACARHDHPIIYKLKEGKPFITPVTFDPPFKKELYFLYLDKKQDTREGISDYLNKKGAIDKEIIRINAITEGFTRCTSIEVFMELIDEHETIISHVIKKPKVKDHLFADFYGSVKSLGAWGGDFVMVASKTNPKDYFRSKGFDVLLKFEDLILK